MPGSVTTDLSRSADAALFGVMVPPEGGPTVAATLAGAIGQGVLIAVGDVVVLPTRGRPDYTDSLLRDLHPSSMPMSSAGARFAVWIKVRNSESARTKVWFQRDERTPQRSSSLVIERSLHRVWGSMRAHHDLWTLESARGSACIVRRYTAA